MALSHHHGGSFPIKFTFFLPPILWQHCSSSRLVFFQQSFRFPVFYFLFILASQTVLCLRLASARLSPFIGGKKSQIHLQLFTHRELRDTGEKKKSCKHSLLHIQKVIQTGYLNENSPIISQLKKKFSASLFSFLNRRWRTVKDVIAVVSHNIRFNWQKSREKIKWSETGWTNEHAQPFRCHWWPVFLCSKVLEQNWQVYKQKECPY